MGNTSLSLNFEANRGGRVGNLPFWLNVAVKRGSLLSYAFFKHIRPTQGAQLTAAAWTVPNLQVFQVVWKNCLKNLFEKFDEKYSNNHISGTRRFYNIIFRSESFRKKRNLFLICLKKIQGGVLFQNFKNRFCIKKFVWRLNRGTFTWPKKYFGKEDLQVVKNLWL